LFIILRDKSIISATENKSVYLDKAEMKHSQLDSQVEAWTLNWKV